MGITASLLLFTAAASAQPSAGETHKAPVSSAANAVQARATTRIMAGAEVRFDQEVSSARVISTAQPQIERDSADILWIEFS